MKITFNVISCIYNAIILHNFRTYFIWNIFGFKYRKISRFRLISQISPREVIPEVLLKVLPKVMSKVLPQVMPKVVPEVLPKVLLKIMHEVMPTVMHEVLPKVIPKKMPKVLPKPFPEWKFYTRIWLVSLPLQHSNTPNPSNSSRCIHSISTNKSTPFIPTTAFPQIWWVSQINEKADSQGRHHQKSKIGASVAPHKKDWCPPNCYFKEMNKLTLNESAIIWSLAVKLFLKRVSNRVFKLNCPKTPCGLLIHKSLETVRTH